MRPLLLLVRGTCVLVASFLLAFALMHFGRRTPWFREHLYRQLLIGDADQKLHAASSLAAVGGEAQLLRALQEPEPQVHDLARRGIEQLWFYASGAEAYARMESAYQAALRDEFPQALTILDQLILKYPNYAEGWNQRAAVFWKMGEYQKSMADCKRALQLNPNHYGAWQGLGVCQLQLGELTDACRSLRAALKILPHDEATQRSLQQCEQLLRSSPAKERREATPALL